jgi:hypothetical protein
VCLSKHVEPSMNGGIIDSIYKVASCWLFLLSCILCFVRTFYHSVRGRDVSLNLLFCFIVLHSFPSSFLSLTHPSTPSCRCHLLSPSTVCSLSTPILIILSNVRRNYFSSSENIQPCKRRQHISLKLIIVYRRMCTASQAIRL